MLHSVRETGRRIRHHAGRAIRTASNVTAAITPGYQKFVHPVLDAPCHSLRAFHRLTAFNRPTPG